jgi:serine/threonine protein kinase
MSFKLGNQISSDVKTGSRVYQGTYQGDEVAIKVLNLLSKNNPDHRKYLTREIEILEELRKEKHVVHLLKTLCKNDMLYMIYEYVNGKDLLKYNQMRDKAHKPLTIDEKLLIVATILRPLAKMHCHKPVVMHRQILPRHILIMHDPKDPFKIVDVILADFSFARLLSGDTGLTKTGFLAPELNCIDGAKNYSEKVDIWGLGVLIFFLLFGRHPEEMQGSMTIYQNPETAKYPKLREDAKRLDILMKLCFSKDPEKRPAALKILEKFFPTFKEA